MELAERDIPESIFLELSGEDLLFCFSQPEPVSISFDKFSTIPLPDPVAEIVPEHRTDDGSEDREEKVIPCPESSHQYHHIHPWNSSTDNRKWLDTGWEKCDEIVPVTELHDEIPDPCDRSLDPLRMDEWYDEECECEESEYDSEEFCDEWEGSFDHGERGLWCL